MLYLTRLIKESPRTSRSGCPQCGSTAVYRATAHTSDGDAGETLINATLETLAVHRGGDVPLSSLHTC